MSIPELPRLTDFAGVRNFGWTLEGILARGEQPPLAPATFDALKAAGIGAVLSLRDYREPPGYHIEDEWALVRRAGLAFAHVPCTDLAAPSPDALADALRQLDRLVDGGRAVLVHCLAGVGRTGTVTGAWMVSRGWPGDWAAAAYFAGMDHLAGQLEIPGGSRAQWLSAIGVPAQWWALRQIARSLGSPVTQPFGRYPAPEPPAGAHDWDVLYWRALMPWRNARPSQPTIPPWATADRA